MEHGGRGEAGHIVTEREPSDNTRVHMHPEDPQVSVVVRSCIMRLVICTPFRDALSVKWKAARAQGEPADRARHSRRGGGVDQESTVVLGRDGSQSLNLT